MPAFLAAGLSSAQTPNEIIGRNEYFRDRSRYDREGDFATRPRKRG
jgi:hypothetical protein